MFSKSADRSTLRKARFWPLAARLTVFYSLSALIILAIISAVLYRGMAVNLAQQSNDFVWDEIGIIEAMLATPGGQEDLAQEMELEHAERKVIPHYTRVLDDRGATLMENPGMVEIIPTEVFPPPLAHHQLPESTSKWRAINDRVFFLYAMNTEIAGFGGRATTLQVAIDITWLETTLANYRRKLALMVILGVAVSALAGYLVARNGLAPLRRISTTIQDITVHHLNKRISPQGWPKELTSLATDFDSMFDRLETSFERLCHYTANLAHELRTPINNLMVEADLALSRTRSPEEYQKVIGSNMEEYARLSRMIDSLLFLERADSKQDDITPLPFDAREEIDAIAEYYSAVAEDDGVIIVCEGTASITADPVLFRRAVSNLLSNALNYTPAGGKVSISASQGEGLSAEIRVSDTGCGIAEEHLPRIFDRFYRVEATRQMATKGSGLGLSIVRTIMELHHGEVAIQSTPGKGTTVTLTFPPESTWVRGLEDISPPGHTLSIN